MNWKLIKNVVSQPLVASTVVGVVAFSAGAVGGYLLAKQRVTKKTMEEAREVIDREIIETRNYYAKLNETTKAENSPADIIVSTKNAYQELIARQQYASDLITGGLVNLDNAKRIPTTVVETEDDHELLQVPDPEDRDLPYLISVDTFLENEPDNSQDTLTYYVDDEILVDSGDAKIPIKAIGEDNLGNFGRGTRDSSIMYIRNERLGVDFEVIQTAGSYAEIVLGLTNG